MKTRNFVLGGVAAIAIAGFAAPGFAQYAGNPPQVSTPEEKAQTEQLNNQAQSGTTAAPAALNGQGGDVNTPSAQNQAQRAQYQQQQEQYEQDKARYHAQRREYERNIHHYDEARYYFTDYPHPIAYHYEGDNLRRLYLIADPTHQLANAPVEGPDGQFIGRVRNVETGVDGRPHRVEIALNRRVSVWAQPGDFRYDADNHILFTHMTRADFWDLPGATYNDAM